MTMFKPEGDKLQVCPYRFVECLIKDQNNCTIIRTARLEGDPVAWSKITYQAGKCLHAGDILTFNEYTNRRRGKIIKLE